MRLDAELEPPGRKARQSACALGAEGRAVVATDRQRQAVSRESACENRSRSLDRRFADARLDQEPGVAVGDRQRIDPALVLGATTLEVGRPFLVGGLGRNRPPRRIERPTAPLDRLDQPGPLENIADRRSRRPVLRPSRALSFAKSLRGPRCANRRLTRQLPPRSPPTCGADMITSHPNGRKTMSPPRSLAEQPTRKRVSAHPIAPAQLRHAKTPRIVARKHSNPLFHPTGLRKRHRKSSFRASLTCRPSTQSKLSGIYPVRTRRGPLTPDPSPSQGEGGARRQRLGRPRQGGEDNLFEQFLCENRKTWYVGRVVGREGALCGAPDGKAGTRENFLF